MNIILSGGGTAGHVYPAIAVANELQKRGHSVSFIGTPDSFESRIAQQEGIEFIALEASGFNRRKPLTLLTSTIKIARSRQKARKLYKNSRPDVVVGFGGYVSIPAGIAARDLRIPLVLHEQNSVPGVANKYLSRHAAGVGLTYPKSREYFPREIHSEVVGNPVRDEVLNATAEQGYQRLGIPRVVQIDSNDGTLKVQPLVLLVFGGSRGARHINEALVNAAKDLLEIPELYTVHVAGAKEEDTVRQALLDEGICADEKRWSVYGYLDDMGNALAAADVIVARAGATSIAEITALGKSAILVPYPYATDDHQTKNAVACSETGAALWISDDKIDSEEFRKMIAEILTSAEKREIMANKAREFGRPGSAEHLTDFILACVSD